MKTTDSIDREKLDAMMREELTHYFSEEQANADDPVVSIDILMSIWDLVIEYEAKNSQVSDKKADNYKNLVHKIKLLINKKQND